MVYAGIDIGGTKCAVVIGENREGFMKVLAKRWFLTDNKAPSDILEHFANDISLMLNKLTIPAVDLKGIGVCCGGPLNSKDGIIISPPNLPRWNNVEIVRYFENAFHVKTYLHNDANACAIAEWKYGAGRGSSNVIFLTFGTGLGAGLILNGKLYAGTNDMAGEIGHVRLTDDGPVGYGKIGSMEGYCSGGGIAQIARQRIENQPDSPKAMRLLAEAGCMENITAKLIAELADKGDELCREVYQLSGEKLGMGLSILIDLINPEVIIIGSIFSRSRHLLWNSAKKVIKTETIPLSNSVCRIVKSELGDHVGDIASLSVATGEY